MPELCTTTLPLNSGFPIPQIGLGTWKASPDECYNAVKHALESGYRHIDTARIYVNEEFVGKAINDFLKENPEIKREDLFVTTKISPCDYQDAETAIKGSLERLGLEYVDLYLLHHSLAAVSGEGLNPVDENGKRKHIDPEVFSYVDAWRSMESFVKKGYTKSIGVCNFNPPKLQRLLDVGVIPPSLVQNEIHPYLPQHDLVEFCKKTGIIVEAFSPLGSTGAPLLKEPIIVELAEKYNCSPGCIAISWACARGTVPLPKSTNPERISANLTVVEMQPEDVKAIDEIHKTTTKRYLSPPWKLEVFYSDADFKPMN